MKTGILANIVENLGRQIEEMCEIASRRFPSWKGEDYAEILRSALGRAQTTAENFSPLIGQQLLAHVLLARTFFQELLESYRAGEFQGACLRGNGQEAVGVGVALASRTGFDILAPEHRSVSAMLVRGTPIDWYWQNHLMRATSPTGGHDPNVHFSDFERRNLGFMVSDMAMSAGVINGAVWRANKMRSLELAKSGEEFLAEERACGIAIFGDGAASNGLAHGGMGFAKTLRQPILFTILDNQIAFRTAPRSEHGGINLANRAFGYEMPALSVDGDNVFEVYLAASILLEFARIANHPALLHARTFRRCGHNESEDIAYMSQLFDERFLKFWMSPEKDPLYQARVLCEELSFVSAADFGALETTAKETVRVSHQAALRDPEPIAGEVRPVLMDAECKTVAALAAEHPMSETTRELSMAKAIREAMLEELRSDSGLVMVGEDIVQGGAFGVTHGIAEIAGRDRILDVPLDEGALAAFVAGVGMMGGRVIAEYQFALFFLANPSPLLTLIATRPYMQKYSIPAVFRFPGGFNPQSNHYHESDPTTYLAKPLGIKIVVASTPGDAKGLMKSAIRDPDAVAFLEELGSYWITGPVPEEEYYTPFEPIRRREGRHVTLVTWFPKMVRLALEAAEECAKDGIEVEVIDLRILNPFPREFVLESVRKTGCVLILSEDSGFMGLSAEIASQIAESDEFYDLRARVRRIVAKNTPIPAHLALENARLPQLADVVQAIHGLWKEAQ